MTLLIDAIVVAAKCQANFVAICLVGTLAAARGLLDDAALGVCSKVYIRMMLPCLLLGLSASFTAERLQAWSPIMAVAFAHAGLGALLGELAAGAMRLRRPHRQLFVLTVALGNCGSLPFVLVLPVATNWRVTSDDPDALSNGMAIIGLYLIVWFTVCFAVGAPYLDAALARGAPPRTRVAAPHEPTAEVAVNCAAAAELMSTSRGAGTAADADTDAAAVAAEAGGASSLLGARAGSWRRRLGWCALPLRLVRGADPILGWILLSVALGCVPPLQRALLREGALSWLQLSFGSLGMCGVILSTVVLGGGLWHSAARARAGRRRQAAAAVVMAAAPSKEEGEEEQVEEAEEGAPRLSVLVAVACAVRLVLLPAISMPLTTAAAAAGLLPQQPMLLIMCHIQSAVPSSTTLVAMLHARGEPALAARVSAVYLPQYVLSVPTVALVIVVAIRLIGEPTTPDDDEAAAAAAAVGT